MRAVVSFAVLLEFGLFDHWLRPLCLIVVIGTANRHRERFEAPFISLQTKQFLCATAFSTVEYVLQGDALVFHLRLIHSLDLNLGLHVYLRTGLGKHVWKFL